MKLDEFRKKMEFWWEETDKHETVRKNSQGTLLELMGLYERFDEVERVMANRILCEWIESDNNRKRFDALAIIDKYKIRSAIPKLRDFESKIANRPDYEAPYELAKVRRILERLMV